MYDELVKAIRQNTCHFGACGMCPKRNALCLDRMALQAADAIEELVTNYDAATDIMKRQTEYIEELSKRRWIPVTERLPKWSETVHEGEPCVDGEIVLVFAPKGGGGSG